ncbi:SDR family NAD(P)-dependent oxidoreductase [Hydrogenovibrio thermophilus]|uniref:SDR family NAD(P)-dependent oxidoreductase n=1 Tax=Hydrogenovibrio thermophilus TaxID=265883 RepID=A0A410H365_9GAMM|nr:SDR family NAD(P)-dependent oxidoreductase [Hydrogenovibrio thermophilus]QAB15346.1 SDR family NAD(P)-dependent oxidoreductase [Hydrogenovibrio thermophilus]
MSIYLITGAAEGLGRSLALASAHDNNQLILLDKNLKGLNHLYDTLVDSDDYQAQPALFPMDLLGANIEHYGQLRTTLENEYGHLDGVFLNAATLPAFTPVEYFDYIQWYEVLHTNLNANFHLIQQTLPLLRAADAGQLVAILDGNLEDNPAYYGAYGVAKAGLEQLMKTVALENQKSPLRFYSAKLGAFQSNTRSRQFPSENPETIPTSQVIAAELLKALQDDSTTDSLQKL